MEDGKINGVGTHEELLAGNDIYKEVYESQTGTGGDFDEIQKEAISNACTKRNETYSKQSCTGFKKNFKPCIQKI